MKLSYYQARQNYYLYSDISGEDSNMDMETGQIFYPSVCGLKLTQLDCDPHSLTMSFGLSEIPEGIFTLALSLTPGAEITSPLIYGYAAQPDANGQCPSGLVLVHPYTAHLPPILFESNLVAQSNDTVFTQDSGAQPANDLITFFPASGACQNGICPAPSGNGINVLSVPYEEETPGICVIPSSDL